MQTLGAGEDFGFTFTRLETQRGATFRLLPFGQWSLRNDGA